MKAIFFDIFKALTGQMMTQSPHPVHLAESISHLISKLFLSILKISIQYG